MDLVSKIVEIFPYSEREALELLLSAPARYKVHTIEKRNGRGKRVIAQPTAEVKMLQRWALSEYIETLPVHDAAMAYRKDRSTVNHAKIHANNNYLLKLDFSDFFPSITSDDLEQHLRNYSNISNEELYLLVRLFCWRGKPAGHMRLSIGAPSSPALSNTIMYKFDSVLSEYCSNNGVSYSRYADDLALSTNKPKTLDEVQKFIISLCANLKYPKLALNSDKTVFTSRKRNRQLTGLVLTNDGAVSLGREKKRELRVMVHKASIGELGDAEIQRLRGLLAYIKSVEPSFLLSVERMIGKDQLDALIRRQP